MSATFHNPFSVTNTKAGAIPFCATETFFDETLLKFESTRFLGQVFGPHGSGKTTFLTQFAERLRARGYRTHHVMLRDRQRALPKEFRRELSVSAEEKPGVAPIMIVDGYEQLGVYSRTLLWYYRFRYNFGLLVTVHRRRPTAPILLHTQTPPEILKQILMRLQEDYEPRPPLSKQERLQVEIFFRAQTNPLMLHEYIETHDGNLRLVLLELYDRWEQVFGPIPSEKSMKGNSEKT